MIAERSIRAALAQVPQAINVYRANLDTQIRQTIRPLRDDIGLIALLDPDVTRETVLDWTQQRAKDFHARTVFAFDGQGVLIARSDQPVGEPKDFARVKWVAEALDMSESSAAIREGKTLAVVSALPILAEMQKGERRLKGVIAASFALDDKRAEALKGITGGQVGFLVNKAKAGEPPGLDIAAATPAFSAAEFLRSLESQGEAVKTLFGNGQTVGPLDMSIGGDARLVEAVPIKSAAGETLGAFVVSRSRAEETAAFRQIRTTLLLIGLAALLVSLPISFAMGRRIARPLEQLAAGAVAIRDGNLNVALPEGGADEVGALARAFRAMVGELREKAQLEQMLAEMQKRPPSAASRTMSGPTVELSTVDLASAGPQPGRIFAGRYRILSMLGKGGMGSVYLAHDKELEEDIALKVLTPEAFEEGTIAVQTLKQEIRLARKITHPNVVRTHDLGESDGIRFLTMEYVPGTMLKEVIERKGRIAFAPGLQIGKQLCRGLGAVHEAGIIHRDIKPHNVMVLPNGVVKLMDFGIARVAEGGADLTAEGQTVGTPYYMSPEQARGDRLDARSDLYSVGVVLYELFTGVRPIEGKDPLDVMRKHITVDPKRPRELRPDIPEILERIILACLAKDPARRPPSSNDLYSALQRVAA